MILPRAPTRKPRARTTGKKRRIPARKIARLKPPTYSHHLPTSHRPRTIAFPYRAPDSMPQHFTPHQSPNISGKRKSTFAKHAFLYSYRPGRCRPKTSMQRACKRILTPPPTGALAGACGGLRVTFPQDVKRCKSITLRLFYVSSYRYLRGTFPQ